MANKSLTDLTARTATADSDLIHVNSGGTDYKQSKINFVQGGLAVDWATDSLLTSQVNALPKGSYFGVILSNNHQTETGVPQNASFYVHAFNYSNASGIIYITQMNNGDSYYIRKYQSTWESSWTKEPTRAEITSLNNSLTQCLTTTPGIITSGRDLNDYKSNGLYIIQSGVTNSPSSWCALLVIGTPTTYGVHQIAFSFSAFYVRSYTGSPMAWTNWRSLTFS